jgi:hypothetical protein
MILLLRLVHGIDLGRPFLEVDLVAFPYAKVLRMYFHLLFSGGAGRPAPVGCASAVAFHSCAPQDYAAAFGVGAGEVLALASGSGLTSASGAFGAATGA